MFFCIDNNITSVDHDFIANRDTSDIKLRIEKEDDETKSFLSNDPATGPISDSTRDYIALHGWIQNEKADFTSSRKLYSDGSMRYLSKNVFKRKLLNGEEVHRPWLVFSESKGSLFCVACLLFSTNDSIFNDSDGFSDWKHSVERILIHENSRFHKQSVADLKQRANKCGQINEKLTSEFEKETAYWRNVLRRVVSATKYLASRGLPFRGTDEKFGSENNGNFFMLIEFLSEFDPLMAKHVNDFGNKGSGSTSYLSKTIYEEFIEIMAREVLKNIVSEVKNAKYFSIIVDSTPDIAHIDQLSFVLRYVRDNGQPVERFLLFIDNVGHKAKDVADAVFDTLEHYGINIADCRGQSYDNAKNMSGQYSGLQARIKLVNELAEWNPCAGHSLNLVGVHAVGSCSESSNFFAIVQSVYNFFSASTHRWAILKRCAQEKSLTLKSLSTTRWSARADAVSVLNQCLSQIIKALKEIEENISENPIARQEAKGIRNQLESLEFTFMLSLWDFLLSRFNAVNLRLQNVKISIDEVVNQYEALIKIVDETRDQFDYYEKRALNMSEIKEYRSETKCQRKRKLKADET